MAEPGASGTESVGERLRRLRLERGLSQRDLSSPGVSYAYISRIEAGARRPSVKALRMLAQKLGVTAEYLETGSELGAAEARELRLAELELRLRLEGETPVEELEDVLEDATAHADAVASVRSQIALGLAATAQGRFAEAAERLERAIASDLVSAAGRPDVFEALCGVYTTSGAPGRAVDLLDRALHELTAVAAEDGATRLRLRVALSRALVEAGDPSRARTVISETLAERELPGDPYARVRVHWSLAHGAARRANARAALASFRHALALLEATDDTLQIARSHLVCAETVLASNADVETAAPHLTTAERLLGPRGAAGDLAMLHRLQATAAARRHDYDDAERLARRAIELADEVPAEAGRAWSAIAEARTAAGGADADEAYRRAIELHAQHGPTRDHAHGLRAYGRYLRDQGREREALDVFERAANVATAEHGEREP
jgi:transcriptional regulator with XRE-family HTH domain